MLGHKQSRCSLTREEILKLRILSRRYNEYSFGEIDCNEREQLKQVKQNPTDVVFIDRILSTLSPAFGKLLEHWDFLHADQKTLKGLKEYIAKIEGDIKSSSSGEPLAQAYFVKQRQNRPKRSKEEIAELKKKTKCNKCGVKGHWAAECQANNKEDSTNNEAKGDIAQTSKPWLAMVSCSNTSYLTGKDSLKDYWIADSGASAHMCNNLDWFTDIEMFPKADKAMVGDSRELAILGKGQVRVEAKVNSGTSQALLKNVLYIPELAANLFSVGKASENNLRVVFWEKQVEFLLDGETKVAHGKQLMNNLYLMDMVATKQQNHTAYFCQIERTLQEWHNTLGHANTDRINQLLTNGNYEISLSKLKTSTECDTCPAGKAHRVSHPSLTHGASKVGERIFIDLEGPINVPAQSSSGAKYYLLCKDEFSSMTYIYLAQDKKEISLKLAKFIAEFEIKTNERIQRIHSDNGSEFINKNVEMLLATENIIHETSACYTPQQNGRIERQIQTINQMVRTMLFSSGLPASLWDEASKTACFIQNILPNSTTKDKTPLEIACNRKPRFKHLCEFGRQVQVMIDGHYLHKFEPRTTPGFVVGFIKRSNI